VGGGVIDHEDLTLQPQPAPIASIPPPAAAVQPQPQPSPEFAHLYLSAVAPQRNVGNFNTTARRIARSPSMIAIPAVDAVGVAQSPATQYGHNQVSVKNSHLAHEQELMAPSLVSMDKSSFRASSIPSQAR
jgi:hypothetical protein